MRSWLVVMCLVLVGAAYIVRAQSTSEPEPEGTTEAASETPTAETPAPEGSTTSSPNGCPSSHNFFWLASSLVYALILCALL